MSRALGAVCATLLAGQGSALRYDTARATHDNYTTDDVLNSMWFGYDIHHEAMAVLERAPKVRYLAHSAAHEVDPNAPPADLVVLAPKDSGMSLLGEALFHQYEAEMKGSCNWEKQWVDHDRPWLNHQFCRVNAHGLVKEDGTEGLPAFTSIMTEQGVDLKNLVVVIVIKGPIATLEAWNTAVKEREPCIKRNALEYGTPCEGADLTWDAKGNKALGKLMPASSTMDIYNRYMKFYGDLMKSKLFKAVVPIYYEDMVESPSDAVMKVAEAMNWKPDGYYQFFEGMPVDGKPAAGRPLVLEALKGRTWSTWIPQEVKDLWCSGLDLKLMEGMYENSIGDEGFSTVPYGYDCTTPPKSRRQ